MAEAAPADMMETRVPPAGVRFGQLLPLGTKARSYTRRFIPSNGTTFTPTQRVVRLELNGPMFMDPRHSFLKFDLTPLDSSGSQIGGVVNANSNISFSSGHNIIERLVITGPDGTELERIENYNVLAEMMLDFTVSDDNIRSYGSYTAGIGDMADNGLQGYETIVGAFTTADGTRTLCLKLISGLLQNKRYLPLLALRGSGLVLELYLSPLATAFYSEASPENATEVADYRLTNIEYVARCVDFDESFNRTFMDILRSNGELQFHGTSFHNFVYTASWQTGYQNIPIAERARSLKAIFAIQRVQSHTANIYYDSLATRERAGTVSYVFNIGGMRYPSAPIKFSQAAYGGAAEGLIELQKAFGNLTDVQFAGRMDNRHPQSVNIGQFRGAFDLFKYAIGIDLENYPQDTDTLESGLDTLSQSLPLYLEIEYANVANIKSTDVDSGTIIRFDFFSMVDVIYVLSADGLLSASD
jgi:hypothetical protein